MASSRFGCGDGFALAGRMTDRRGEPRPRAARLVQVAHDGDAAYARCRDFSDTGMKLDLTAPLALHDEVTIALTPSIVLCGTVAWVRGRKCGIVFDGPVDSESLLDAVALEGGEAGACSTLDLLQGRGTAPRNPPGQRKGTAFKPGLSVTVMVSPNREQRGVVRWAADDPAAHQFAPADPYQSDTPLPQIDEIQGQRGSR
jgi:hypothetical protein